MFSGWKTYLTGFASVVAGAVVFHINPVGGVQLILGGLSAIFIRNAVTQEVKSVAAAATSGSSAPNSKPVEVTVNSPAPISIVTNDPKNGE